MKYAPFLSILGGALLFAQAARAATLIEYRFDDRLTPSRIVDMSGNDHNASFNRDVSIHASYPFSTTFPELAPSDKSGRARYNAQFSGAVTNVSTIDISANNQFTMEGWVYLEGFARYGSPQVTYGGTLWSIASEDGGTSRFALRYTNDGTVEATFNSKSQDGGQRTFNTGVQLALGVWTHIAYVKTTTAVQVYINGVGYNYSVPGITSRLLPAELSGITVAANIYGRFDDFRFSDVALAPEELGFYAPFTPVPEPSGVAMLLMGGALGGGFLARRRKKNLNAA